MQKFKTIEEFKKYNLKKSDKTIQILVGMGTCGIAAGADKALATLKKEIEERKIENVELRQVGCLGLCFSEPNVEVRVDGMPNILYGKVSEDFACKIIEEHIEKKNIIDENIYDIPYIDILN